MKAVFLLQHSYEHDGNTETKIIGVYSSKEVADAAVQRFMLLPGFSDHPHDFFIDKYEIDRDNWNEGFETL